MSEKRKDHKRPVIRNVQPVDQAGEATGSGASLNSAATAALALAVTSARKAAEPESATTDPQMPKIEVPKINAGRVEASGIEMPKLEAAKVEPSKVEPSKLAAARPRAAADWTRYGAQAAALALALGLGWLGGSHVAGVSAIPAQTAAPAWAEVAASGIHQNHEDTTRLTGDVKALKAAVDAVRDNLDRPKADTAGKALAERLDRVERLSQDASALMARLGEQLTHLEHANREPLKLGGLNERLDRIERQVTAAASTVASAAAAKGPASSQAPDPTQTGSVSPAKPDPKQTPIEGWALREVYDGVALVEGRNNRLHEVAPGQTLPGLGRVEAIERRGKAWVVVTDKGVIGTGRW